LELKKYNSDDIFVIGGEEVYTQLLPYCSEAHVTKFNGAYSADRYFPNLDEMEGWKLVCVGEPKEFNDIRYNRLKYVNENPKYTDNKNIIKLLTNNLSSDTIKSENKEEVIHFSPYKFCFVGLIPQRCCM